MPTPDLQIRLDAWAKRHVTIGAPGHQHLLTLEGAGARNGSAHFVDFLYAFVRPGADPRAKWRGTRPRLSELDRTVPSVFEAGDRAQPRPVVALAASRRDDCRYVPIDVCRWRNPKHRAELTRRARELAAAVRKARGE